MGFVRRVTTTLCNARRHVVWSQQGQTHDMKTDSRYEDRLKILRQTQDIKTDKILRQTQHIKTDSRYQDRLKDLKPTHNFSSLHEICMPLTEQTMYRATGVSDAQNVACLSMYVYMNVCKREHAYNLCGLQPSKNVTHALVTCTQWTSKHDTWHTHLSHTRADSFARVRAQLWRQKRGRSTIPTFCWGVQTELQSRRAHRSQGINEVACAVREVEEDFVCEPSGPGNAYQRRVHDAGAKRVFTRLSMGAFWMCYVDATR
jgi:hypothetical protein